MGKLNDNAAVMPEKLLNLELLAFQNDAAFNAEFATVFSKMLDIDLT
jgi:hypothetical protein